MAYADTLTRARLAKDDAGFRFAMTFGTEYTVGKLAACARAQYETESPTRDCYAHGYVIPNHTAASCAGNYIDDVLTYFNVCVHDALTGNW